MNNPKKFPRPWHSEDPVLSQDPPPAAADKDTANSKNTRMVPNIASTVPPSQTIIQTRTIASSFGPLVKRLLELQIVSLGEWQQAFQRTTHPEDEQEVLRELANVRAQWVLDPNQFIPALSPFQLQMIQEGNLEKLRLQNHVLLDYIGGGGMGDVYKARNVNLCRIEAIKTIRPQQDLGSFGSMSRQRFEREARILATLNHPYITTVYYSGYEKGMAYIAMEFVSGENLETWVREARSNGEEVPVWWAVQRILGVAEALEHAHQHDVIHRDIKPGNIMITGNGLKVLDMGIAKLASSDTESNGGENATLTQVHIGIGTPQYMPPEQWLDARSVEPSSDLYSLGCTLYFVLTGSTPFQADSPHRWMYVHVNTPPPSVSQVRPDVPKELDAVIRKALAKMPQQRYRTATEFIAALKPFAAEPGPIHLPLPKKHGTWMLGAAAFLVAAATGVTVVYFTSSDTSAIDAAIAEVTDNPESAQAHLNLGQLLVAAGRHEEADNSLTHALQLKRSVEALVLRAETRLKLANPHAALADGLSAWELASPAEREQVAPVVQHAYQDLAENLRDSPADLVELYEQAASKGLAGGLAEIAAEAWHKLAEQALQAGDWKRAAEDATKALETTDQLPGTVKASAHLVRGKALAQMGRGAEAVADALLVAKLDSQGAAAQQAADLCIEQAERYLSGKTENRQEATAWLNAALEIQPDSLAGLKLRGKTLLDAEQFQPALADLDRALQLQKDASALQWRAQTHLALGNFSQAREDFLAARNLARTPAQVAQLAAENFNRYGQKAFETGQFDQASKALEAGLEFAPASREMKQLLLSSLDELATQNFKSGRFESASSEWERALKLAENEDRAAAIRKSLVDCLAAWGNQLTTTRQPAEAIRAYDRAIELSSSSADLYAGRGHARRALGQLKLAADDFTLASKQSAGAISQQYKDLAVDFYTQFARKNISEKAFDQALEAVALAKVHAPDAKALSLLEQDVLLARAKQAADAGDWAAALADHERLQQLAPGAYAADKAMLMIKHAKQLAQGGNRQQAEKLLAEAETLHRSVAIFEELAEVYRVLQRPEKANAAQMQATLLSKSSDAGNLLTVLEEGHSALRSENFELAVEKLDRVAQELEKSDQVPPDLHRDRGNAHAGLGKQLLRSKRFDEAISAFLLALKIDPGQYNNIRQDLTQAYISRGVQAHRAKDYRQAIENYNLALRQEPQSAPAYFNRGLAHEQIGQARQALVDYQAAAELYLKTGDKDSATETGVLAAKICCTLAAEANDQGDFEKALSLLEQAKTLAPPTDHYHVEYDRALLLAGEQDLRNQRVDAAISRFNQVLEHDNAPGRDRARALLAEAYLAKGNAAGALELAQKGLAAAPDNSQLKQTAGKALDALASAAKEKQDWTGAVSYYQQALKIDPQNAQLHREAAGQTYGQLAEQAYEQAKFNEAIQAYRSAAAIDPENSSLYHKKLVPILERQARFAKGKKELDKAADLYLQAAKLATKQDALALREEAALAYQELGLKTIASDFDQAIKLFDRAIEICPEKKDQLNALKAITYNNRGLTYYRNTNYEAAIRDYSKAIEFDGSQEVFYRNRGLAYRILAQQTRVSDERARLLEQSIADYSQAIERNSAGSQGYFGRGFSRFLLIAPLFQSTSADDVATLRKNQSIFADFEQATKRDPYHAESFQYLAYLLASWPDKSLRDGDRAVKLATRACELQGWKNWQSLQTLGTAYAQAGQYKEAVQWMDKAIELAPTEEYKRDCRILRDIFEKGSGPP